MAFRNRTQKRQAMAYENIAGGIRGAARESARRRRRGQVREAHRGRASGTRASASPTWWIKAAFIESGLFGASGVYPEQADETQTDGKLAGYGEDQRPRCLHRRQRLHGEGRVDQRHQQQENRAHEARRHRARHAAGGDRRIDRRAAARRDGLARHGAAARQRHHAIPPHARDPDVRRRRSARRSARRPGSPARPISR